MENFQVNLQGIIQLLSKNLYSSEDVFLRELLQNAVDAITARHSVDTDFEPCIRVQYLDGETPQIVFSDNGIGLDESEIVAFLTTIGSSTKRETVRNPKDFIGQFGIGLLSCFMICDQIVMTTQSVRADYALKWVGHRDGTYASERLPALAEPGTSVYISVPEPWQSVFTSSRVAELLIKYGRFLPHPVIFENVDTGSEQEVTQPFPEVDRADEGVLLGFGQDLFDEEFQAAIPLVTPNGHTQGVAYIRQKANLGIAQSNRVYLKGMLLSDKIDNLLPDWAYFLRVVVNTTELTPTASRERLYQDSVLRKMRVQLGQMIRKWLVELARENPERAEQIIDHHRKYMKEMAAQDEGFLRIIAPFLRFPTTMGRLTVPDMLRRTQQIDYVFDEEEYKQIQYLCRPIEQLVVHTRYDNDQELVDRLSDMYPDVPFREVNVRDFLERLEDVDEDQERAAEVFLAEANHLLQDMQCTVMLKQFDPAHIPTLYYLPEEARRLRQANSYEEAEDSPWSKMLDSVMEYFSGSQAILCLNARNPMVGKLMQHPNEKLRGVLTRFLYIQAILLGNYTLSEAELRQFGQGLTDLLE